MGECEAAWYLMNGGMNVMKKVLLIGPGGAGKSTLAKELGKITEIPVIHLDAIYWKPGWVETGKEEWKSIVEGLIAKDSWIMDGNYGGTLDARLAAADTVVFFDFPPFLCIWRFFIRRIKFRKKNRPDMAEGCNERISWTFLKWVYHYRRDRKPGVLEKLHAARSEKTVFVLSTRQSVSDLIESLRIKYA